ncbi:hemerythrin domain-containing protein [Bradymonas sediminis]|nr:hemerythrin domain-containing protein [Bradymonas sediminis]TDP76614.1 hemerythrin HHE cation binding domain-containing protein [Bradymonas sediminis]
MEHTKENSELLDVVHHEHDHLCRLFDDIGETFEKITSGELEEPRRGEALETAQEDLQMALEEMLHHFNQEEEVFFVEIEAQFPEYAKDIARLVDGHELICDRTRWLNRQLKLPDVAQGERPEEILKVIKQMCKLVHNHAVNENRLFDNALARMPADQRERMREEISKL